MEIREKDGQKAVIFDSPGVVVITYTLDNEIINEIGIVKEKNAHFSEGYSQNLIMGRIESDDTSMLERAMKELYEEGGLKVEDSLKWNFLGEIYTSKISPDPLYIFSVNVTGQKLVKIKRAETENVLSFSMLPVTEALKIQDSILQTSFFKLFMKIYQKEIKDTTCTTYQTENNEEILQES